jgi:hypothetical protein
MGREVDRSVQWIQHPAILGIDPRRSPARLLADHGMIGEGPRQPLGKHRLNRVIGLGDHIERALRGGGGFAEITFQEQDGCREGVLAEFDKSRQFTSITAAHEVRSRFRVSIVLDVTRCATETPA